MTWKNAGRFGVPKRILQDIGTEIFKTETNGIPKHDHSDSREVKLGQIPATSQPKRLLISSFAVPAT